MKTVKPRKLGLLTRPFERDHKYYLAAAIMAYFPLSQPERLLSEQKLWQFLPAEMGAEALFDEGLPKQSGEVLVWGACHCPNQRPRLACPVTVKIGSLAKTLHVFGDRFWIKKGPLTQATDPQPFTVMPIRYENAFGGRDYPPNPRGKGLAPILGPNDRLVHPLPNIEAPNQLIASPDDQPAPAGFGPWDLAWPQRFKKAGTYDKKWFEERFPGFAADMDWTMFNLAPPDQRITGFFRGDEALTLENMHPDRPVLNSALPGLATRCFVRQLVEGIEVFKEIPTHLDTIWLFPQAEKGVVIFRGVLETDEDDAQDVRHIMIAAETLGEPRSAEYYQRELDKRLDKDKGYLFALRDRDLLPSRTESPSLIADDPMADCLASDNLLQQHARRRAEQELENARNALLARGLDPAAHLPASLPVDEEVDLDNLDILLQKAEEMAAQGRKDGQGRLAQAEKELRSALAGQGLDYDQVMAEAKRQAGGRPKFKAAETKEQLKTYQQLMKSMGRGDPEFDRMLADPHLDNKLAEMEKAIQESYRKFAQHFPAAVLPGPEEARRRGLEVEAGYKSGQDFTDQDLTGIDISHLNLKRASFKNAVLEGANLSGTDLSRADLSGAILVGANLAGAILDQAVLREANLARANLTQARLNQGVDLSQASLAEAELSGADLTGARLEAADLSDAKLAGANFSAVSAPKMLFKGADLTGVNFHGADLSRSIFINVQVPAVDFGQACLEAVTFVGVKADGATFAGARMAGFRAVSETTMAGADFSRANLVRANLRGVNLEKANFTQANLEEADLSSTNLEGAVFYRAVAKGARFIRANLDCGNMTAANLWDGNFQKAQLHGTNFTGTNLFRANFLKARADKETVWTNAFLNQALFKG